MRWEEGFRHASEYAKEHGNLKIPTGYICEDGFKLFYWLTNQKTKYKKGMLSEEQAKKLTDLGIRWKKS